MGKNNRDMKGANNPMFGKKRPDLAEYNRNRAEHGLFRKENNPMFGKFVALCRSCHTITNGDREFWEDWYTEIINEFYGGQCYLPKETEK